MYNSEIVSRSNRIKMISGLVAMYCLIHKYFRDHMSKKKQTKRNSKETKQKPKTQKINFISIF